MINYEEINELLTPERVKKILDKLKIPYEDKGDFLIMPTVCHNASVDDASHKLYYYFNNHIFVCYTEDGNMSIWKFLRNFYETRNIDYDWYTDIYKLITDDMSELNFNYESYKTIKKKFDINKEVNLQVYDKKVLDSFIKYYPIEWLNDRITKKAMDKFNILFSPWRNKIIIPHYNVNNELIGIRGRALNKDEIETFGKYMPVQVEGVWYKHPLSMNLYGLNVTKENIKKYKYCYLFEAEKSVLQLEGFKMPNCGVAVCGSQFNKFALHLLMKEAAPQEIIICFDREEKPGEDKYYTKLKQICEKYKNYANFSFIYDRRGLTDMKDSPTDKGEEIFKKLLGERVKVK